MANLAGVVDGEMRDEMMDYHKNGLPQAVIGDILNISQSTVGYWLKRIKDPTIPRGRQGKVTPDKIAKIVELRRQGLLLRQIADEFGLARSTVGRHLRERQAK